MSSSNSDDSSGDNQQGAESGPASLYDRIGGREGILRLITPFYTKVRRHPVLGPIFSARISDWPAHLEKIAGFWSGMTGGPLLYGGGMGRHFSLGIGDEHFEEWLGLWDQNARELLAPAEAGEMSRLAHAVGDDLRRMISRYKPQFGRAFDVQTDE